MDYSSKRNIYAQWQIYAKRCEIILSLISFVFLLSCSFKPAIQVPKPVHIDVIVPNMDDKYDSVLYWYIDDFNIKKSRFVI